MNNCLLNFACLYELQLSLKLQLPIAIESTSSISASYLHVLCEMVQLEGDACRAGHTHKEQHKIAQ